MRLNGRRVAGIAMLGLAAYWWLGSGKDTHSSAPAAPKGPEAIVQSMITSNKVLVFSKSYCGFSQRAKGVLGKHLGPRFGLVVELDQREDADDIQDYLLQLTGGRTVPRVFVDGAFIGGSDDLMALERSGKLAALLKDKGLLKMI